MPVSPLPLFLVVGGGFQDHITTPPPLVPAARVPIRLYQPTMREPICKKLLFEFFFYVHAGINAYVLG